MYIILVYLKKYHKDLDGQHKSNVNDRFGDPLFSKN